MPPPSLAVKWNKQSLTVSPVPGTSDELKSELERLTGVPADRQTLLNKAMWKGALGNGVDLGGLAWPAGEAATVVTMMGTPAAGGAVQAPPAKVVFMEDLAPAHATAAGMALPSGLENLGNTCYLNSTLQMLRAAPEFSLAVVNNPGAATAMSSSTSTSASTSTSTSREDAMVAKELRALWTVLSHSNKAVSPLTFVGVVRTVFPRFNEQGPRGGYIQQDADDFYNELMASLGRSVRGSGHDKNAVDEFFSIGLTIKSRCVEAAEGAEPITTEKDRQLRLVCLINDKVSHLEMGLKLYMEDEITKLSPSLNRDAVYHRTRRVSRLPKYLTVQLNRFFWKLTPDSMDHRGVNCKILRAVKFPQTLDVFDLCDEPLQQVLAVQRDAKIAKDFPKAAAGAPPQANKDVAMATGSAAEEDEEIQRALALSMAPPSLDPASFDALGAGIPPTFGGRYELVAVVSHKGRASNSGHYMSWVKQPSGKWVCFDDEHPSECQWEDVERLAGGGDHHMAYMLLYRALA